MDIKTLIKWKAILAAQTEEETEETPEEDEGGTE